MLGCSYAIPVIPVSPPQVNEVPWCFGADIKWKQRTKTGELRDIKAKSRSCFSLETTCQKASKLASDYARLAEIENVTTCSKT